MVKFLPNGQFAIGYWHGCPVVFVPPKTNREWWAEKIQANIERDLRQTKLLKNRGWLVL